MEGKSNAAKVVKGGVNAGQEGEGIVVKNKKQNFTRWMDVLDCSNPLISPMLKALAALQGNSCSKGSKIKQGGKGRQDGKGIVRKQHAIVIMGTDVLGCPVCSTPLSPPIFQCSLGHFVCLTCRDKLPGTERACGVCSRPVSDRCHGVERIVGSVLVPCSYYAHGCTNVIAYHQKGEHEKACRHAPCFCPVNGCCFAGTTEVLLDHFTTKHKWPITVFKYYEPFDVPVKVGMHVLHGSAEDEDKDNDSNLFLLNVGSPGSRLHEVSLVRIQAHEQEYGIGCSVGFSWFRGQYQVVTVDIIRSSSLSNGLLECCVCTVPQVRRGGAERVVLSVTIGLDREEGDDAEDVHSEVNDSKKDDEADRHNAE